MKDGGSAFPVPGRTIRDETGNWKDNAGGMSLRDWFAGMALAGYRGRTGGTPLEIATTCYEDADAMLEAREAGE